jgi:hypothetical protein
MSQKTVKALKALKAKKFLTAVDHNASYKTLDPKTLNTTTVDHNAFFLQDFSKRL